MSGMPQEPVKETQLNFPLTTVKAVDGCLKRECKAREKAILADDLGEALQASQRIALLLERRMILTNALSRVSA